MPHAAPPPLLGVLLAGGRSSRMGTPKALLPHPSGGTFLTHSLDRLRSVCEEKIVVSLASEAHRAQVQLPRSVPALFDSQPALGPAMGVWVALQHASSNGYEGCLFTPVDLPDLSVDDLLSLVDAWRESCWHSKPIRNVYSLWWASIPSAAWTLFNVSSNPNTAACIVTYARATTKPLRFPPPDYATSTRPPIWALLSTAPD